MADRRRRRGMSDQMRRLWGDERGAGSVTVVFVVIAALMVGGLAVDYGHAVSSRAKLQAVADAASHAAAVTLGQGAAEARAAALAVARAHEPGLLNAEDIAIGHWVQGRFEPASGDAQANAVAVVTRRATRNGNPLPTFLLPLIGRDRFEVSAVSVSAIEGRSLRCSGGGFFARNRSIGNTMNTYDDGFCLHGEAGVAFHNNNHFAAGTEISLVDPATLQEHRNNSGVDEALRLRSHEFTIPQAIPGIITAMRAGSLTEAGLPEFVSLGPVYRDSIDAGDTLYPGTLYVVSGTVVVQGARAVTDVAIVAAGDIAVSSNVTLDNVVLVSSGRIAFNSNIRFGGDAAEYCLRGSYGGYVFALDGIAFNSNNTLRGILMGTQGDLVLNSNNRATDGLYAEALGDIVYNSRQQLRGCASGLETQLDLPGRPPPSFALVH